jgi:hypothetical protein
MAPPKKKTKTAATAASQQKLFHPDGATINKSMPMYQRKIVRPTAGSALQTDKTIVFSFKTGPHEYTVLPAEPFQMKYAVLIANPENVAGETDDSKIGYYKQAALMGDTAVLRIGHLPETLGPAAFFDDVNVTVDKIPQPKSPLSMYQPIYQKLNRVFMTTEAHKKKYGYSPFHLTNSGQYVDKTSEAYKKVYESMDFVNKFPTDTGMVPRCLNFTFDGIFPFGTQNNALEALTGKRNKPVVFPPNTEIVIRLSKRSPIYSMVDTIEWVTDKNYFEAPDQAASTADALKTMELKIQDLVLNLDVYTKEAEEIKSAKIGHTIPMDYPHVIVQPLAPQVNHADIDVNIPPGSKILYICFPFEHETWFNAMGKRNLSTKTCFPKNLVELTCDIGNQENTLLHRGLKNPGIKAGASEPTCLGYVDILRKFKLFDGAYSDMFDEKTAKPYNYNQVFIVPIPDKIRAATKVTLHLTFNKGLSPRNCNVLFFAVSKTLYNMQSTRVEYAF